MHHDPWWVVRRAATREGTPDARAGPQEKAAGEAGGKFTGRHYKERNQIRPTTGAPRAGPKIVYVIY